MGTNISLFSGYSQSENRTTNYCLLILKMIYEENPKFLAGVLSTLIGEEIGDYVGVKFYQQQKKKNSVPDGFIVQKPYAIYIETKNFDWFYDSQLEKHLDSLDRETTGLKILIALGNFELDKLERFERIINICKVKYNDSIVFTATSFEEFINAIKTEHLPKNLEDTVSDFNDYLNNENLLPTWQYYMDVVNCAGFPEVVNDGNVYMCPTDGGSYNHARCKYFGMYRNKRVEKVASIEAVADVESESEVKIKWVNGSMKKNDVKAVAMKKVKDFRGSYPARVFLLGELYDTNFIKDSKGGMMGSKQYFDISSLNVKNSKELADALSDKTWSNYNVNIKLSE